MEKVKQFLKKKYYVVIPFFIALGLAILAYFFQPEKGYDLNVYHEMLIKLRNFNFQDAFHLIVYRGEFLIMFYFYIMANLHLDLFIQILPTFLFYFIFLYIIFDYSHQKNIKKTITVFVTLIFLSLYKYIFIVTGIRYGLACSLFILGIYLEFIKLKPKKAYFLYIIPLFIHTSTILLVFFRLLSFIKNKKVLYCGISLIGIFLLFPQIPLFLLQPLQGISFFNFISQRILMYTLSDNITMNLQYFFRICQTCLLVGSVIFVNWKLNGKKTDEYNKYYYIVTLFTLFSTGYYWMYMRFVDLIIYLSLIKLLDLFSQVNKIKPIWKYCLYTIFILFVLAGIRIQIPIFIDMYF